VRELNAWRRSAAARVFQLFHLPEMACAEHPQWEKQH
jgi:hypothetical protein